jgi:hypothetical protein
MDLLFHLQPHFQQWKPNGDGCEFAWCEGFVDKRGGFLFIFDDQDAHAPTLRKCHLTVKNRGQVNG